MVGVVFYNVPARELAGPAPESPFARALVDGLREKGWLAGQNLTLVWRTSEGRHERIPALVEELIRFRVDVLVASGNDMAAEAVKRAPSLPVVLASSDYPVENGLATSLARPGGSVTGLTNWVDRSLNAKRISLLKEAVPRASRIALMGAKSAGGFSDETRDAASKLGVGLSKLGVDEVSELAPAFDAARRLGVDAILVTDYPFAFVREHQAQISVLAMKHRMPVMHSASSAADAGGLMSFAPDIYTNFRRAGYYVDKILRGAKPGELPIEQPANLELVINLQAARNIGLEFPAALQTQATRVIQ